jgi:four helix bundle protein
MGNAILSFRDLRAYRRAYELQQSIFRLSRNWPKDEKYALTDQIRRSSRSIGANLAESWAKRDYPLHFVSKLTDAEGELQETLHWLSTAKDCEYLSAKVESELEAIILHIGGMIGSIKSMPEKFTSQPNG